MIKEGLIGNYAVTENTDTSTHTRFSLLGQNYIYAVGITAPTNGILKNVIAQIRPDNTEWTYVCALYNPQKNEALVPDALINYTTKKISGLNTKSLWLYFPFNFPVNEGQNYLMLLYNNSLFSESRICAYYEPDTTLFSSNTNIFPVTMDVSGAGGDYLLPPPTWKQDVLSVTGGPLFVDNVGYDYRGESSTCKHEVMMVAEIIPDPARAWMSGTNIMLIAEAE